MKEHEWLTITARLYGAQDLELESESAGCRSTHDEVDSDFMASDWIPFAMGALVASIIWLVILMADRLMA